MALLLEDRCVYCCLKAQEETEITNWSWGLSPSIRYSSPLLFSSTWREQPDPLLRHDDLQCPNNSQQKFSFKLHHRVFFQDDAWGFNCKTPIINRSRAAKSPHTKMKIPPYISLWYHSWSMLTALSSWITLCQAAQWFLKLSTMLKVKFSKLFKT